MDVYVNKYPIITDGPLIKQGARFSDVISGIECGDNIQVGTQFKIIAFDTDAGQFIMRAGDRCYLCLQSNIELLFEKTTQHKLIYGEK